MQEKQRQLFIDKISNPQNPTDEFEREALLGGQSIDGQQFYFTLNELDALIDKRVSPTPSTNFYNITLKIAAGIVLLMAATIVYIKLAPKSSAELLAEFFEPFPNTLAPIQRGGGGDENVLSNAMAYYEGEQYQQAVIELESYVLTPNARPEAYLYLGVAYLSLKRPDRALTSLSRIYSFSEAEIREAAYWYSTLAYLLLEDKRGAAIMAHKVVFEDGFYQKQAQKILNSI